METPNKEAFVYCWADFGTNKLYVGVHKGTPDDGYVCSSKPMLEEYTKRPNDFSRQVLAFGTYSEMFVFETAILKAAKADKDPGFYNMHLNNGEFTFAGSQHTEKTKQILSERKRGNRTTEKTKLKISQRLKGIKRSEEFCKQRSVHMMGNQLTPKGYKHDEEFCAKASRGLLGNTNNLGSKRTPVQKEKHRQTMISWWQKRKSGDLR